MKRSRARSWALGAALFTAVGLLEFWYHYLDALARGASVHFAVPLIEELTAAYGAGLLLLGVVVPLARRVRAAPGGWPLRIARLAAALPAFSVCHTLWNYGTRTLAFAATGMGRYDYGILPTRFAMEFPVDLIIYTICVVLVYLFDHYRDARDRELQLAQLETELTRLRLEALEAQLRPHFLFNALNTVSAVMYEDVAAADAMLTGLGDLLRRTLRRPTGAAVSLAEELETLELYLAIMRARFADRLSVTVDVEDGAGAAAVPPLLLQPLVENALRHGDPGPDAPAVVTVRGRRRDGRLLLEVEDNGPGIDGRPGEALGKGGGIGLDNTARRLAQLYGDAHAFSLQNRDGGGLRVSVEIPFREAPRA